MPIFRLAASCPLRILAATQILYWVGAYYFPARILIMMGDAFAVPMSSLACLMYSRSLYHSFKRPNKKTFDSVDMLTFAIAGAWGTGAFDRFYRLILRGEGIPSPEHYWIGALQIFLTVFAGMHIIVRGSSYEAQMSWFWNGKYMVAYALIVGMTASMVIFLSPLQLW